MSKKELIIEHARENNLKSVSCSLPHDQLTVITGLSGSGKSSFAFDTVYAEGQRRYIETFSPYTRQFFDKVKKPDVDMLRNVRPAIAIQQRTRITSARSTVGSLTNCNDYLKVLFANLAHPVCPKCGKELVAWTPSKLAKHLKELLTLDPVTVLIGSAVSINKKHKDLELDRLRTLGFSRVWDEKREETVLLEDITAANLPLSNEKVLVILDRFKSDGFNEKRIRTSLEQAFSLSQGSATVLFQRESGLERSDFFNDYVCPDHAIHVKRPKQYLFSFNHPLGACEKCKGFGYNLEISRDRCIPDRSKSIEEGAVQCWTGNAAKTEFKDLLAFCKKEKIKTDVAWSKLSAASQEKIFTHKSKEFWGILPWFGWLETKKYKMHVRVFLSRYREPVLCDVCGGSRLRQEALGFRVHGKAISDLWTMSIADLLSWLESLQSDTSIEKDKKNRLKDVFANLLSRLRYLRDLGLPYLTLDRLARTLSGGETQRVNLATALGSELVSTQFVLDEPSVGLHPRDSERLIKAIHRLTDKGNSLLVVEHDPECIYAADNVLELGPQAGKHGGEITYIGSPEKWSGISISVPSLATGKGGKESIKIKDAYARNLKHIDVEIPLGKLVCLTGVSGSGKSTLIHEVLEKAFDSKKGEEKLYGSVSGCNAVKDFILIDQAPLARSPRANIATYTKIWDAVRELLSETEAAKGRGLTKSSFSFNVDAGRCPACEGAGFIREDMQFLSDVYIPCDICLGKRFQPIVLEVEYGGKNIDDFLKMTIDEACTFFQEYSSVREAALALQLLGLGSLTLGHPMSELSGGEAQRLKLIPFLQQSADTIALLVFDEPTTGLHIYDIERLISLFKVLLKKGHSILCVEHNLSVIANADWVIDLGPEGGDGGGYVIAQCAPSDLIKNKGSQTGAYLARYIDEAKKGFKTQRRKDLSQKDDTKTLRIEGAREHNLKDVSVSVPSNALVAVTGVSGSGKSTLAKDIIYAEGQRRYLDCLSPYARQFIKELKKPDIDHIENVRPTICVYQHTFQPSQLSTVGTMSEVYNFLRLLYAKTGTQYCPDHPSQAITALSSLEISREILALGSGTVRILAPVVKLKKGNHNAIFTRAMETDVTEVRVDGLFGKPSQFTNQLTKSKAHSIDLVVAKFNPKTATPELVEEGVKTALAMGGGTVIALTTDGEKVFSSERTCPVCKKGFFKADPEDLSFNSKRGACPKCAGFGVDKKGKVCPECGGARLGPSGRNIRILGKNIHEAIDQSAPELESFLEQYREKSSQGEIIDPILRELRSKLGSLVHLGLDFLNLNRDCASLSGGEMQRLRLATAMGSPLSGVLYIFDEPSAGLHPLDNEKVLSKLAKLRDDGNSLIIIEHDPQSIRACDYIIDVGPGAGVHGGEIVYTGDVQGISNTQTPTAHALTDEHTIGDTKYTVKDKPKLHARNVSVNNLKDITVDIPLQSFVTIGGVSGAGKSSLVHKYIADQIQTIRSDLEVTKLLYIDQKPIGANSRSTPASYLGIWDEIRKLYAQTLEAKSLGWDVGHFSYNTGRGRCPVCKGAGIIKLEMNFLAEAEVICDACGGLRYNDDIEMVRYGGLSIGECLQLTFEEARERFANHRKIHYALKNACDLGLGYLTLGQSSTTLSGGESQRLKLVSELSGTLKGHILYILDEPTLGLHRSDVAKLLVSLRKLVDIGHTVIVIEHDIDTICASDYFIELGPGAGEHGGTIIGQGTPLEIAKLKTPWGNILKHEAHL